MKPIDKDELYQHLSGFLKAKGIELKEGSYAHGIQKSCTLLADAINLGQQGLKRAKVGLDKNLDKVRQVIHEKTAPKTSPKPPAQGQSQPSAANTKSGPNAAAPKSRGSKRPKGRKTGK